ncbi:sensor histidine kinase [Phenylobacterium sp.]|jgi:PAS domain S-box-containing protein|uniref:sensor histidine kinase n=1 Tax=Phenylobacterium sp. TaxID=1871053 RepID=UPI002F959007
MADQQELLRRQRALADFGEFVLDHDDLQAVLDEGCRLVAEALGAELAKVLQIDRGSNSALVRAGVGWRPGIVGRQRVDLTERSSETHAIETTEPVITNNIERETRFDFPQFLHDHGVIALVNVPILLPGRTPYGVLQVDAREPREFDQQDIEFLKTYAMVLGPVVDRLKTVVELRETDERLRLLVDSARDYVVVVSDADDLITDWLGGSEAILGWSEDEVLGKSTALMFTKEDRDAGAPERELGVARRKGSSPNLRWHLRKDGGLVFLDGQTIALRDGEGSLRGYLKIAQDVTERRRAEERQAVLTAELQHRVRNVLAMVSALVRRTVKGDAAQAISEQLQGRIDAMARTQALLTRAVGQGVDLENLVKEELLAQSADGEAASVAGPQVKLSPKAAEVLTLAIHELATNSVKYGALGQDGGRLAVAWRRDEAHGAEWLRFEWVETGLHLPPTEDRRRGFGTELITRRVPYELRGHGHMDMRPEGVRCTMEIPLVAGESILETGSPA